VRAQAAPITWPELERYAHSAPEPVAIQIGYLLSNQVEHTPRIFWLRLAECWEYAYTHEPAAPGLLADAFGRAYAQAIPAQLPDDEQYRLFTLRRALERALRARIWSLPDREWLAILKVLDRPALAQGAQFSSPLGRLVVYLIRVTPTYPGLTPAEWYSASQHWPR